LLLLRAVSDGDGATTDTALRGRIRITRRAERNRCARLYTSRYWFLFMILVYSRFVRPALTVSNIVWNRVALSKDRVKTVNRRRTGGAGAPQ
jgi:hypothetical protein